MTEISLTIGDNLPVNELLALREYTHIDRLTLYSEQTITTEVTRLLAGIQSVGTLSVWQTMTRTALRDCLALPYLQTLEALEFTTPGKVVDASTAVHLTHVYCDFATRTDLWIFSQLPQLKEIRAHNSAWSADLLARFIRKPTLQMLDIEASNVTDTLLEVIATSKTLTELDIGASQVTGKGLAALTAMPQLQALDIWRTAVVDADLAVLTQFEHLTYLALGGCAGQPYLTAETVIPVLLAMPRLKNVWLDNIIVDASQLALLDAHFDTVRYDYDED